MPQKLLAFFKKEPVLCVSLLLALASACWNPPSPAWLGYVDFRVLALLFCLMLVTGGLRALGVFRKAGRLLLGRVHTARTLTLVLVFLCFFSSMLLTNDVALITFVPFAIEVLAMAGLSDRLISVVVLQTVAANLGSMATPIGNPQNLYLFGRMAGGFPAFFAAVSPYAGLSALLLAGCAFLGKDAPLPALPEATAEPAPPKKRLIGYALLFLLCLGTVARLLPWPIVLGCTVLFAAVFDRPSLKKPDYCLLGVFTLLFLFVGNLGALPAVRSALASLLTGRELAVSLLASQIISNVPAAILLSGFTERLSAVLVGVNLGGLGTLIASMASLISFQAYAALPGARKGRYLAVFTLWNLAFLAVLTPFALLLQNY